MYQDLQPLRISAGWTVTRNLFFEEDIDPAHMDTVRETLFCAEDNDRSRAIDLEWVPESKSSGFYELKVVNLTPIYDEQVEKILIDYDYESPYYKLQSANRMKIVSEINRLMWEVPILEEERILKAPGLVDEPSESFRLKMINSGLDQKLFNDIVLRGNGRIQNLLIDHPKVTPDMLKTIVNSVLSKKIKNKASMRLNSKRYKKAHGLWTDENPDKSK